MRGEEGSVGYHVHLFSDVTRDREVREELTHLATHDVLTGVANRRWFIERLQSMEESGARHRRRGERVGILFCDVDDLKALNDTYGHGVGDEALTAVADGLARGVRNSDDVGRMGGDEFVVILDGLTSSGGSAACRREVALTGLADAGGRRRGRGGVGQFRGGSRRTR